MATPSLVQKYPGGPGAGPRSGAQSRSPSLLIFLLALALFTILVTLAAQMGWVSSSFVKTLGKALCLCLAAVAMDLIWGYAGIPSLGHMAFFAIGGYMIGLWLMYARTAEIVVASLAGDGLPSTPEEISQGIATQIFGVVGASDLPAIWGFAHSLPLQLMLVVALPALIALIFGWRAFRGRVTGDYLSIMTQAMTVALALYHFQNDSGRRGNNGLSGLQNLPGVKAGQDQVSLLSSWFTGGRVPDVPRGFATLHWVDCWQVLLRLAFVAVTLFAPNGIGGLFDLAAGRHTLDCQGQPIGPSDGSLQEQEAGT